MTKWEYKIKRDFDLSSELACDNFFPPLGGDGWELVGCVPSDMAGLAGFVTLVFKRPLPEKQECSICHSPREPNSLFCKSHDEIARKMETP